MTLEQAVQGYEERMERKQAEQQASDESLAGQIQRCYYHPTGHRYSALRNSAAPSGYTQLEWGNFRVHAAEGAPILTEAEEQAEVVRVTLAFAACCDGLCDVCGSYGCRCHSEQPAGQTKVSAELRTVSECCQAPLFQDGDRAVCEKCRLRAKPIQVSAA